MLASTLISKKINHQQSNGKAERFNALLENYLRCYVGNNHDWIQLLPLGEFVINSAPSTSLKGLLPFEADIWCIPNHPHDIQSPVLPEAISLTERLDITLDVARHALAETQQKYNHFDIKHQPVTLSVGDFVFVDNSVFTIIPDSRIQNLAPKLRGKFCGPFRISEKLSDLNYRLELPSSSHTSNVFHVSQLRLTKPNSPDAITAHDPIVYKKYQDGTEEMEISSSSK